MRITTDLDPIVAIATACGRGGIGIIRISFGNLNKLKVLSLIKTLCGRHLKPRHASFVQFLDEHRSPIDNGIALYFPEPNSYTGEHVLELHGHGSQVVMQLLLRNCINIGHSFGLRLAQPGEFTRRAYLNEKLDLAQAESIADLIEASTEAAARSAARSLDGTFSRNIYLLVDSIIDLRSLIEAMIDFPEERIASLEEVNVTSKINHICIQLDNILGSEQQSLVLRNGLSIVLVGEPNVGKSSLLNALVCAERAIVTPIPGTTRDKVIETMQISGIPIRIIDTAGLCETDNEVERIGIEHTWIEVERADVLLHLLDARVSLATNNDIFSARFPSRVPIIRIFNKTDLAGLPAAVLPCNMKNDKSISRVRLSAMHGEGIDLLREELMKIIATRQITGEDLHLARDRHLTELRESRVHLEKANTYAMQRTYGWIDLFSEELRLAQERLNSITGIYTSDDLLGEIFSRFCVGK